MTKKIHLSARGKEINFDELFLKNKNIIAITGGGAAMNASGDTLGPGGKVLQTGAERDRISNPQPVPEGTPYNADNPNAVRQISIKENIDNLAALVSEPQTGPKELPEDDAANAKTPEQVIKEFGQTLKGDKADVEKNDKPNIKNKRKIVDTDD